MASRNLHRILMGLVMVNMGCMRTPGEALYQEIEAYAQSIEKGQWEWICRHQPITWMSAPNRCAHLFKQNQGEFRREGQCLREILNGKREIWGVIEGEKRKMVYWKGQWWWIKKKSGSSPD